MYGFGGLGEVEVEIWTDVTIAGQTDERTNEQKGKIGLLSQWTMEGWDEQYTPPCVNGSLVVGHVSLHHS